MTLWTEADPKQQALGGNRNGSHISVTYLRGDLISEIRRFVVICEGFGNVVCVLVSFGFADQLC